jgi:hypothetical protein
MPQNPAQPSTATAAPATAPRSRACPTSGSEPNPIRANLRTCSCRVQAGAALAAGPAPDRLEERQRARGQVKLPERRCTHRPGSSRRVSPSVRTFSQASPASRPAPGRRTGRERGNADRPQWPSSHSAESSAYALILEGLDRVARASRGFSGRRGAARTLARSARPVGPLQRGSAGGAARAARARSLAGGAAGVPWVSVGQCCWGEAGSHVPDEAGLAGVQRADRRAGAQVDAGELGPDE